MMLAPHNPTADPVSSLMPDPQEYDMDVIRGISHVKAPLFGGLKFQPDVKLYENLNGARPPHVWE